MSTLTLDRAWYLRTEAGDRYLINDVNGNIIRMDQADFMPSGQWSVQGVATDRLRTLPGDWRLTFADIAGDDRATRYKNGKPRYRVIDFDHGTLRIWGNRGGIAAIRKPQRWHRDTAGTWSEVGQ